MNRRELLKYFGAGAVITANAAAEPIVAQLIQPAEVKLITEPKVIRPGKILGVTVTVRTTEGNYSLSDLTCEFSRIDGEPTFPVLAKDDIIVADVRLNIPFGGSPASFAPILRARGSGPIR